MRALAALALAFALPAQAAQLCPTFQAGWANSYYNSPISSVSYDPSKQLLYVVWGASEPTAYWPVPTSIIQTFSRSQNPVQTFNSYVAPRYGALLLQEKNACPILQETGAYIWTTIPTGGQGNVIYDLLLQGSLEPLRISKGVALWLNQFY